jgi:hypothetical protein
VPEHERGCRRLGEEAEDRDKLQGDRNVPHIRTIGGDAPSVESRKSSLEAREGECPTSVRQLCDAMRPSLRALRRDPEPSDRGSTMAFPCPPRSSTCMSTPSTRSSTGRAGSRSWHGRRPSSRCRP